MPLALIVCCLLAVLLSSPAGAGACTPSGAPNPPAAAGTPGPPPSVGIDHGWQYHPDPTNGGAAAGWALGNRGQGWLPVTLPVVFDTRPLPELFHGSVGWYRTTINPPATPGFSWAVNFEQIRRTAQIWLNGRLIGSHSDPYTPFQLPLTGLRPGQPNTLVVRVDNRKGSEPREGWWNWGGITRSVSLVPQGPVVLDNLGVLSKLSCPPGRPCSPASFVVDGWVSNHSRQTLTDSVSITLRPPGGGASIAGSATTAPLKPGQRVPVQFTVPVPNPQLWSPDHPNLYSATVLTSAGGQTTQRDQLDVGLRSVEVHNGLLYLNGRQIDVRGAGIQEDVLSHGAALTDGDMNTIVSELKALNANVTRAHYPLNPGLLDRLDRAGIMVWSQAPIYHRDELLKTPAQRASALATLRGTVLGDRSHPSVIVQSVANEPSPTPDQVPSTTAYLNAAVREARGLNPSVPVALDILSYPGYPRQRAYDQLDLLGINNYFGWYAGKPGHVTARLEDLAPYLRQMHTWYPHQAMVMTEFGAEATMDGPATEKQTYAFQSDYIRRTLGIVSSLPFMSGAIYWTLQEFAVKPYWDGGAHPRPVRDSLHHKGLISYAGVRKPAWGVAAQLFGDTPLYPTGPFPAIPPPPTPAARPQDYVVLGGAFIALALLISLSLWGYFGLRRARRESEPVALRAWRLEPSQTSAADTTYA